MPPTRRASQVPTPRRPVPLQPLTVQALSAHREVYRSLAANLPRCSLHVFDRDLRFVFAGGPALEEHGFDPAQIEGRTLAETVPPGLVASFEGHYRAALAGQDVDFDHVTVGGQTFHTRIRPVRDETGAVVAGLLVSEDVTQAREVAVQYAETAQQLQDAQRLAGLGCFVYDLATNAFRFTEEFTEIWGLPLDATGHHLLPQIHPDDAAEVSRTWDSVVQGRRRASLSYRIFRLHDGDLRHLKVELAAHVDSDGRVLQVRGTHLDVTDLAKAHEDLERLAHYDSLTGLPHRGRLLETLGRRTGGAWGTALLYVDLDEFKRVNDEHGHPAGDAVLRVVAQRLRAALRDADLLARVGGDEFVALVAAEHDPSEDLQEVVLQVAARLRAAAAEPVEHAGVVHVLSASVGVRFVEPGLSHEDALRDADAAMYSAKQDGRDATAVFEPAQRQAATDRAQVEGLLRRSLASGDLGASLHVLYQPVVELETGDVRGVEALCRLTDDAGIAISPEVFVAVAERSALVKALGEAVLVRALTDMQEWRARTPRARDLRLAVNLSAREAQDPLLSERVLGHVRAAGLRPEDLALELTETVLLSAGLPALTQLRELRRAGIRIAIDDFGVGYASLRYLATLPVTSLKVDRSFTSGLPHDVTSAKIVKAVIGLAEDMGLTCIVEGIETPEQLAALPTSVFGQGYLLGRPETAARTAELLEGWTTHDRSEARWP